MFDNRRLTEVYKYWKAWIYKLCWEKINVSVAVDYLVHVDSRNEWFRNFRRCAGRHTDTGIGETENRVAFRLNRCRLLGELTPLAGGFLHFVTCDLLFFYIMVQFYCRSTYLLLMSPLSLRSWHTWKNTKGIYIIFMAITTVYHSNQTKHWVCQWNYILPERISGQRQVTTR